MTTIRGFWKLAARDPQRPAVVTVADGEVTTFGELAATANRLSNGLRGRGLGVGDVLALVLSNRVEYLALQLAAHQIGLHLLPVNRHLTTPETAHILADSGAALVVVDERTAEVAVAAAAQAGITAVYGIGVVAGLRDYAALLGEPTPPADRVAGAMLFYSSGTTGRPKGILRQLSGLTPELEQERMIEAGEALGMTPDGMFLSVGPLYHAAPNQNMFMGLQLGQTVILAPRFDPASALALIQNYAVTDTFLVPTMMHRLLAAPGRVEFDVSSLRTVLHGGGMCPVAVKRAMIDWLGPVLMEYYGSSESRAVTLIGSADWLRHEGSVGRPKPGLKVRICGEDGVERPVGTTGMIQLHTGFTVEYIGDPAKTASSYQDGYFIPGDIGYLDEDGWLFVCDRRTDLIVSGGVNIYPAEIEGVLLAHPDVHDAAVFGAADPEWGQSVVALVELREPVGTEELARHCRESLAKFKLPRVLEVVAALPRTPMGKVNRGALREAYESSR
ncbi:AMP-binding protein [Tomitella biformata]|uniref:AMP-binding protein n=1 Tax=Tomitella biformata TaxID=630403 RepID=UPI0004633284|nr:AMP-binding protein [Tomitella biformata]